MKYRCTKGPTNFVVRKIVRRWTGEKTLCFGSQVKIPLGMQRKSLLALAKIRKVEAVPCFVRALDASLRR